MWRMLALGDSYTIGEAVRGPARWPNVLARLLRARHLPIARPQMIAKTGWTSEELLGAIKRRALRGPYRLVTLLIGVNNQYRGMDLADYARDLQELLERAQALTGEQGGVLMLSIPDWGVTPFAQTLDRQPSAIAEQIDEYNSTAAGLARSSQIPFVDVTAISRAQNAALAEDGLHPAAAQYRAWASAAVHSAESILRRLKF